MSDASHILILYIEDEPTTAEFFQMMLEREAKKHGKTVVVEWAQTFDDGVDMAGRIPPPDFIFVDLILPPQNNAMHTIGRLHELQRFKEPVPVEVLTGNQDAKVRQAVESLGIGFSLKQTAIPDIFERVVRAVVAMKGPSKTEKQQQTRFRQLDELRDAPR